MATGDASAATLAAVGPLGFALDIMARNYTERTGCNVIPYDVALDLIPEWTIPIRGSSWTIGATCGWAGEDLDGEHVISALTGAGMWREVDGVGFAIEPTEASA